MQIHLPPDYSEPEKDAETLIQDYILWRKARTFRAMVAGALFSGMVFVGGLEAWGMLKRTVHFPIKTVAASLILTYMHVRSRMYASKLIADNDAAEENNPAHYQRTLTQCIERLQQRLEMDSEAIVSADMEAITELVERYRHETPDHP